MEYFYGKYQNATMNSRSYIFSQLVSLLPRNHFDYLVKKYQADKYLKTFSCWNHLLVLVWAQLTQRESLRDIVGSLRGHKSKFYHLGFGKDVCRSTLSVANEQREVEVFRQTARRVVEMARVAESDIQALYLDKIKHRVFALDSTTIVLDKSKFTWSHVQNKKGGIKLHTLFDLLAVVPAYNIITDHDVRDQSVMHLFPYEKDAFYVFDKAYMKLVCLRAINKEKAFFVLRRKRKMNFSVLEDRPLPGAHPEVMRDAGIRLSGRWARARYKEPMRIVTFYDTARNETFEYLTNNFDLPAERIAYLYRCRWGIEMFFKWIKQHLLIKSFWGTSESAVKIQVYSAIIAYCLVAIATRTHAPHLTTFEALRMLSVSLFEKDDIADFLAISESTIPGDDGQMSLDFF